MKRMLILAGTMAMALSGCASLPMVGHEPARWEWCVETTQGASSPEADAAEVMVGVCWNTHDDRA